MSQSKTTKMLTIHAADAIISKKLEAVQAAPEQMEHHQAMILLLQEYIEAHDVTDAVLLMVALDTMTTFVVSCAEDTPIPAYAYAFAACKGVASAAEEHLDARTAPADEDEAQ